MLEYRPDLDTVYRALADSTRRGIIARLASGPASVSDLAAPYEMSLAAVVQHVQVLEESGLVTSRKVGRVRTCELDPETLRAAAGWIDERRAAWERRFDRLGALLDEEAEVATKTAKKKTKKRKKK